MMIWTFLLLFFALGAIIGSFLNVVTLRYGTKNLYGRSHCFSCGRTLRLFELVPVFSFLLQQGRCRGCHSRFSVQYPLVELITGVVFAAVLWRNMPSTTDNLPPDSLFWWLVVGGELLVWIFLIALSVYDFKHKILPDGLMYGALGASSLLFVLRLAGGGVSHRWLDGLGGFFFAAPFALLWFFSKGRAMGLGDAKLVLLFSWFLGFAHGLSAIIVGFWSGAALALGAFLLKASLPFMSRTVGSKFRFKLLHLGLKTELPLGPFLVLGLFLVYLFGWDVTGLTTLLAVSG